MWKTNCCIMDKYNLKKKMKKCSNTSKYKNTKGGVNLIQITTPKQKKIKTTKIQKQHKTQNTKKQRKHQNTKVGVNLIQITPTMGGVNLIQITPPTQKKYKTNKIQKKSNKTTNTKNQNKTQNNKKTNKNTENNKKKRPENCQKKGHMKDENRINNCQIKVVTKKTKKCQPAAGDMTDLIQTDHVPNSGLARTKKTENNKKKKTKSCRKNGHMKNGNTSKSCQNNIVTKKTKKCQPAAGDMTDLIQTVHVPNSGLTRPTKKISERKNKINKKLKRTDGKRTKSCRKEGAMTDGKCNKTYQNNIVTKKTKKCQPAAGDMTDLIQTDHVPNSRLTRPKIKISERKNKKYKNIFKAGKRTERCQHKDKFKKATNYWMSQKKKNQKKHSMNGNKNTNFTVINCNKGNSEFKNRKADIEHILRTHKPDFMTIHELNITDKDPNQNNNIPGYKLEIDQLYTKFGRARTGIFIKENIKYQRLKEIEVTDEPVVWLQINLPGNKKIKIQSYYRQWRQLDREGRGIPGTETQKQQNLRFKKIAEQWSQQIQIGETISFSDTNINLDKNFQNTNELENCERKFIPIYRDLNDLIFNRGAAVIKTAPTKIYDDKPNTFIDHCISSHPKKF